MCKKQNKAGHRNQILTDIQLKHTVTVNEMMISLVRTLLETKLLLFLDVLYLSRLVGGHNVSGGR